MLADKADDLGSVPGAYVLKEEADFSKLPCALVQ